MTRDTFAFVVSGVCLCVLIVAMLADITGYAGIRLPRDAWTCTDQGPSIRHDDMTRHGIPDWRIAQEACKQWSKK